MPIDRGQPSIGDTGGSAGQDELAASFSEFARTVEKQQDLDSTLAEVVRAAVELIPGCDESSISLIVGRRKVSSDTASSELAREVDRLQEKFGQGPCLNAAYEHETVRVPDMATETRWPRFTAAALEAGAAGMLCFQLYVDGDDLGSLNLFARTPWAFNDESEHVGLMFAAHAAVAYAGARQVAGLDRTLVTSQVIGQAQGILMERHHLTAANAFSVLVRVSQHHNIKLRDVAQRLVHSGELDDPTRN